MFRRSMSWFICIFVAVAIATNYSDPPSTTGSIPEVRVYHIENDNPESSTVEPDQEIKQTTATDLGALLDAGDGAIVTLVVGETRMGAHRAVLAARSPVLATMLHSDTLDASSGQVAVLDVEGQVLRQLLAFLYTQQAPQLPGMAPQLLAAADRYGVSDLKAACEEQVVTQLSVENAAATAVLALKHSTSRLGMATISFIREHLAQVMDTEGWADAVHTEPEYVLQVTRLLSQPPVETSVPATTGSSRPSPSTRPHSEHSWMPTTAAAMSTAPHTSASADGADVSRTRVPPTAASATTPSSSRTPAHTATPTVLCPTLPPDDPAVSRLRKLTAVKKGKRLITASFEGNATEVQAALTAGADTAVRDEVGFTALHWAARNGRLEVARCLLASGAAVGATDIVQQTPLHLAARDGHAAVARLLLEAGANVNARTLVGLTPLHYTAYEGRAEAAAALLEAGADRGAKANNRETPLDIATMWGHQHLADILK